MVVCNGFQWIVIWISTIVKKRSCIWGTSFNKLFVWLGRYFRYNFILCILINLIKESPGLKVEEVFLCFNSSKKPGKLHFILQNLKQESPVLVNTVKKLVWTPLLEIWKWLTTYVFTIWYLLVIIIWVFFLWG